MPERILTQFLYLLVILPICYFTFKNQSKETHKVFTTFCIYFITIQIALFLPLEFSSLNFLGGSMNWTGKIYSIITSILFLILYRKFSLKEYSITLKQNKNSILKSVSLVIGLILLASLTSINGKSIPFNLEKFSYQLTMPGLEEELAYRGIILGILSQILIPFFKIKQFKINPSILITSILFGLIHSMYIENGFDLTFNSYSFCITFITGYVQGYITILTGSILLPIIGHNIYNTTLQIFKMLIN